MPQTKVYLLDGGTIVADLFTVFWNLGPGGEVRFPCYSVLIDHPDGRFLFDTGYDYDFVEKVLPFQKPIQKKEQTIPGALSLIGLKPEDITHVINSHYHFDHCGGNKYLKEASVICHSLEFGACKSPQQFEKVGYSYLIFGAENAKEETAKADKEVQILEKLDMSTLKLELIKGDQEIAKGLWLFETPGHSAGHYSLMVELAGRRPMLFTADACFRQKNLDLMCISSFHLDPKACLLSMQRLKGLAEKYGAELFYPHDPDTYPAYLKAPLYYL